MTDPDPDPDPDRRDGSPPNRYSEAELREHLEREERRRGRPPTKSELQRADGPSPRVYQLRYGGVLDAIEELLGRDMTHRRRTDAGARGARECPVCGATSTKVYRCTECGADLAERSFGSQSKRGGRRE